MSLNQKVRKLDLFKKVPRDFVDGSNIGGCLSIVTIVLIIFYIVTQFRTFLNPPTVTQLDRDELFTRQQLIINLDIQFPRFPCQLISLDLQDVMMSHSANIASIKKYRMDKHGRYMDASDFQLLREKDQEKQLRMVDVAFQNQFGCRLQGSFTVKQVPGNFHISSHVYGHFYNRLKATGKIKTIDVSHKINHLYFGKQEDILTVQNAHKQAQLTKLNNHQTTYDMSQTQHSYTSHYHIDIVPTSYQAILGSQRYTYQYLWNHNSFKVNHMPTVYFNYHIGGIKVEYISKQNAFFQFLLNLCAVIGGVYALANFFNNTIQTFMKPSGYQLIN